MGYYTEEFYENQKTGSLSSAEEVVPYILSLVRPESVVDIGCGVGTWLSVFKKHGVQNCVGVDGDYVDENTLLIKPQEFRKQNLNLPIKLDSDFDLAISLEVAEHIEEKNSDYFVQSLTGLAPVILFSAAIPLQTGEGHINEQWPDYWAQKFGKFGFIVLDCLRGKFWNNTNVKMWYKQNMMIFVRETFLEQNSYLRELKNSSNRAPLSIVHPEYYMGRSIMCFSRPWYTLRLYYREMIVEFIKKHLPDSYVVRLKKAVFKLKAIFFRN